MKRRATEKHARRDLPVIQTMPSSAGPTFSNCDCFFPKTGVQSEGQMDNLRPSPLLRTESRTSTGRECHIPAKVAEEAERLRELEGHVYNMMEGVIRRRRHRDSENLDISLQVLVCFSRSIMIAIDDSILLNRTCTPLPFISMRSTDRMKKQMMTRLTKNLLLSVSKNRPR